PPEPFALLSVFGTRSEIHSIASFARRTFRPRNGLDLLWPRGRCGRQPPASPDQRIGLAVQWNSARTFSSNRHSTAKSRGSGPSGAMWVLAPSIWATIVVRLVAAASLLVISIVALG